MARVRLYLLALVSAMALFTTSSRLILARPSDDAYLRSIADVCKASGSAFPARGKLCNTNGPSFKVKCDHAGRITELSLYVGVLQLPSPAPPLSCLTRILKPLNKLSKLELQGTGLEGTVPSAWGGLTQLKHLKIYDHRLSGTLPTSFKKLRNLRTLEISGRDCCLSALKGPLPSSWGALNKLEFLNLAFNQIPSKLPPSWGGMVAMREMRLHVNQIRGPVPKQWLKMTKLQQLWTSGTSICGPLNSRLNKALFPPGMPLPTCKK